MRNPGLGDTRKSNVVALRSKTDEIELLTRIISAQSDIAVASHRPHDLIDVVLTHARALTGSEGAAVEVLDRDRLLYAAANGIAAPQLGLRFTAAHGLAGLCVQRNEVLCCDDAELDPRVNRAACRRLGVRSMLVAPLHHAGRTIGVLKVMSTCVAAYRDVDLRTLQHLSGLIGSSLGHALMTLVPSPATGSTPVRGSEAQAWADRIETLISDRAIATVFQPVVRFEDRQVIGYEALSRFPPGTGSPDLWFGKATACGLGLALEIEAARAALDHLARIPAPLRLSINVSPETLLNPALDALLQPYDRTRLTLEITEHSTVDDYEKVCRRIVELRRQGLKLAIDDAGAGFASLRHILQLVPDIIKLDVSLTKEIDLDTRRQALVSAILTFALGTSTRVVVEGVETEGELQALVALGVELGQGYYLGRPGPLPER